MCTHLLRHHLRGTECRPFMADVKLRVEAADCGFCLDLLVTCAESDCADRHGKRSAVVVVEVPSALAVLTVLRALPAGC